MKRVQPEPRNVLLVYDHAGMSQALSNALGLFGHFCFQAKNFAEAEEILRESVIHIIFCDCSIDGDFPFDFIERHVSPRKIPCHLISADPEYWNESWERFEDCKKHAGRIINLRHEVDDGYPLLLAKIAEAPVTLDRTLS